MQQALEQLAGGEFASLRRWMKEEVCHQAVTFRLPKFYHDNPVAPNTTNFKKVLDLSEQSTGKAMDCFTSMMALAGRPKFGVLKIENIPFGITKAEIVQFLGRDVAADFIAKERWGSAIHIIMERSTGKTMDCYVELKSANAVKTHYHRHFDLMASIGQIPRLANRSVTMSVSSQAELLRDLFPRARAIEWTDGVPQMVKVDERYSTGFRGFLTNEEFFGLLEHARNPGKYPFAAKCPQRLYESVIDMITNFPWASTGLYTVGDRNRIVETYLRILDTLVNKVQSQTPIIGIGPQLLIDFIFAGVNCPGFGERQRAMVIAHAGHMGNNFNVRMIHNYWPFDVVAFKRWMPDDELCKTYLSIVEKGVRELGPEGLMPQYFFHTEGRLPSGMPPPIEITHFEFKIDKDDLTIEVATTIELGFKDKLMQAGRRQMQEEMECEERRVGLKHIEDMRHAFQPPTDPGSKWKAALGQFGHFGYEFVPDTPKKSTALAPSFMPQLPSNPTTPNHHRAFSHPYAASNPTTPIRTPFDQERRASEPSVPPGGPRHVFSFGSPLPPPSRRRSTWSRPQNMISSLPSSIREEEEYEERMQKWPTDPSNFLSDGNVLTSAVTASGESGEEQSGHSKK